VGALGSQAAQSCQGMSGGSALQAPGGLVAGEDGVGAPAEEFDPKALRGKREQWLGHHRLCSEAGVRKYSGADGVSW